VFKIVTEDPPPVDPKLPYSSELRGLIDKLLQKDPKERPSIAQFLSLPVVKLKMTEYVQTKGQTLRSQSIVFQKQLPQVVAKPQETPKQRMEREKRERADARSA
jgi:serine/threonine protein kinase